MKNLMRLFVVAAMLAATTLNPTPGKAQGLVEYALILVLAYGVSGDSIGSVYRLDHAGAVGPDRPNCSFTGTAEIDFIEVATGESAGTVSTPIVLGDLNEFQIVDPIEYPAAPPGVTLAAAVRLSGAPPANCTVVVNHFKSKFGATTEAVPEARAGVSRGPFIGFHDGSFDLYSSAASDPDEPPIGGVIINLGENQVANLGLAARPRSVAPGRPPEDCALDGSVIVRRLDNGGDGVEIPFEGDPVAFLADVTDGLDPAPPGEIQTYTLIVVNNGPSSAEGSKPPCDDVQVVLGVADRSSGETAASTYVNVHSTRVLSGEPR